MTPKHFIAVCLRLFALWTLLGGLQVFAISTAIEKFNALTTNGSMWIAAVIIAVFWVVAFLLWILSAPLATALLSGVPKPQSSALSLGDIIVAGCVLIGLWWIKDTVIPLVELGIKASVLSSMNNQSIFDSLGLNGKISVGLNLAQFASGLFFVFRPFSVAKWVTRMTPILHAE